MTDIANLPNLGASVLMLCSNEGMSYGEAMAFLIQVAEMAAEMEHSVTAIDQEPVFLRACNIALIEYRKRCSAKALANGKTILTAPKGLQ